jgi:hypothetical protein
MGRVEGSGEQPFLPILVAPAQQDGENMCFARPLREYRLPKKRRKLTVRPAEGATLAARCRT